MRKPNVAKPRSAPAAFSLSRKLPKLKMPLSAAAVSVARPHPHVGRPGLPLIGTTPAAAPPPPAAALEEAPCNRCGHGESHHPVRYVCDKYPHPDPLQICGCESERLEELCSRCGHKARSHKPRHRCRALACKCWGFEG